MQHIKICQTEEGYAGLVRLDEPISVVHSGSTWRPNLGFLSKSNILLWNIRAKKARTWEETVTPGYIANYEDTNPIMMKGMPHEFKATVHIKPIMGKFEVDDEDVHVLLLRRTLRMDVPEARKALNLCSGAIYDILAKVSE